MDNLFFSHIFHFLNSGLHVTFREILDEIRYNFEVAPHLSGVKFSLRSHCRNCSNSKLPISISVQELSLSKLPGYWTNTTLLNLFFPKYSFDSSFFCCFNKTSCFILQFCNKIIGTYFEKCGKVSTLSSDYKMICIDEYCQSRDKTSTCDTYSKLSRLYCLRWITAPLNPGEIMILMWFVVGFKYIIDSKSGRFYSI